MQSTTITLRQRGFTLIEIMVTVAIVAIIASVAIPSYSSYVTRSRIPVGLDALTSFAARMEQAYQDTGSYGAAACRATLPVADNFTVTCAISGAGQGYTATATGSGQLSGYAYTINNTSTRRTTAHPKGAPAANCWSIKGSVCDA